MPTEAAETLPDWLSFFMFSSANVLYVTLGCVTLGMAAGLIGCFAFLRKRSLIGDALAHAALPGVCVAFMLTGTKDPLIVLLGASVSCWLGALSVDWIVRHTRCKEDSALGMVLSLYFGVGIMLLTAIRQSGNAAQGGLDKFLFGQAASLVREDVVVIAVVGGLLMLAVMLAYKELKLLSFDPDFAIAIGLPGKALEIGLSTLIVLAVAIGLQTVGVVLMAALLVTPAAAARYWTERLPVMLGLAAFFGGISGFLGAYISYLSPQMPTGPWMVVAVSTIFLASLLFAPQRGVLIRLLRTVQFRRRTALENVLRTLYLLGEAESDWSAAHAPAAIIERRAMPVHRLLSTLHRLQRQGAIAGDGRGCYRLTPEGIRDGARMTRVHRLWELYLTRKLELAPDHVHDDAETIEHILTPELEARLAAVLDDPEHDPHARSIPPPAVPPGEPA
jgi:manganese/zinc/iron transport system permease protein